MHKKIVLGLGVLALAFAPAKKTALSFQLAEGKTYAHKAEITSIIKQTAMGQVQEQEAKISATTYMVVSESGATANTYDMWYDNIGMDITMMGQDQSYASDTASLAVVDPMSALFASLTNAKFKARISHKGLIEEVMGLEEHIAEVTGRSGENPNQMSEILSSSFGDNGLARNIELTTHIFPEGLVGIGDTWVMDQTSNSGLPVLLKNTYTLDAIEGQFAKVSVKGTFTVDPNNERMEQMGMEMLYFLEGERMGNLTVEIGTGWVTSATFTDEIGGSLTISPSDQLPDGMTMPIEATITTQIIGE